MKILTVAQSELELELSLEEVRIFHQAFNEVCNGFRVVNFQTKIGDRKAVQSEMTKLADIYRSEQLKNNVYVRLKIPKTDITMYRNALREVSLELDEWDFDTRMGIPKRRAQELADLLSKYL